ncbi:hypothetical protein ACA910_018758 [Epithemia clementina (nom. ined.)]
MGEEVSAVTPSPMSTAGEATDASNQATQETGKRKVREQESDAEHIKVMLAAERDSYPRCKDYLSDSPSRRSSSPQKINQQDSGINEAWRRKLCEWCYEVVDHFGFDREVVSIAMNYLDRSVALRSADDSREPVVKKEFQLLAVTSLYIAIKTHGLTETFDGPRRKLKIDAFTQLSRGVFTVETIESSEREILDDLKWKVNPPTNLRFISYFLRLLPVWSSDGDYRSHARVKSLIYEVSRYLSELSVCVSKFSFTCTSSMIAYASILCAMEVLQDSIPFPYDARVAFLKSIAESAGLFPEAADVRKARNMLKELCPCMFEGDQLPSEFQFPREILDESEVEEDTDSDEDRSTGKASPVCVVEESIQTSSLCSDNSARRKRTRTCKEEPAVAAATSS